MAFFSLAVIVIGTEPLKNLDRMCYDRMLRGLGTQSPHPAVIVVDIDEESLARYGQWPWPRHLIARLLRVVSDGEPNSVGVDILFPERDRTSPIYLNNTLKAQYGIEIDLESLPSGSVDNDILLSQVLLKNAINLGVMFRFGNGFRYPAKLPRPRLSIIRVHKGKKASRSLNTADAAIAPIPLLAGSADGLGFVNVVPDQDGVIREAPLFIQYGANTFPSLALTAYMRFRQSNEVVIESDRNGVTSIRCADTIIPVDRYGNMSIRFRGPSSTYPSVSAQKLLSGELSSDIFQQKIVFLGSSAEGLKDTHPTPFDRSYSGVEVHASVVGALLDRDFITIPHWSLGAQGTILFLMSLFTLIAVLRFSAWGAGLVFICFLLIVPVGSGILFSYKQVFLSPASTTAMYIMSFALMALIRFRTEEIRKIRQGRQLIAAQDSALVGLASLVETRDIETGNHIIRTQKYVRVLTQYLTIKNPDQFFFHPEEIDLLCKSSALHDIGKVGIPDKILLKPGRLTPAEFNTIKKHTLYGAEAIRRAEKVAQEQAENTFLHMAKEIALTHHEKWDGTGYPQGLKGDEIPVCGRIMALADVYDALIMKRVYKDAMAHDDAAAIILAGRGSQFDPKIVEAFESLEQEFKTIAHEYR